MQIPSPTRSDSYKNGDYVIVNDKKGAMPKIGKIEEIQEDEGSFTYSVFFRPEETNTKREPYHGKNELLKSNVVEKESLSNIAGRCQVQKIKNFIKLNGEEKSSDKVFVFRQMYDPFTKRFTPDTFEPDCFCKKIVNPDDDLFTCDHCDNRLYHYACITSERNSCTNCGTTLLPEDHDIFKKRKLEDNTILLKVDVDKYYESMQRTLDKIMGPEPTMGVTRNTSQESTGGFVTLGKRDSHGAQQKRLLPNISEEACRKVLNAVEGFSKQSFSKNLTDMEKMRLKAKENYYKCMLYGYEELRDLYKRKALMGSITENEKKLLMKDEANGYNHALTIAMNIEAAVWASMQKNKGKGDQTYQSKNRTLLRYLLDDSNYELRLKVLTSEKKPEDLCQAEESELAPSSVNKLIQDKEEQFKKESFIKEESRLISKSHKGEQIIDQTVTIEEKPKSSDPIEIEEDDTIPDFGYDLDTMPPPLKAKTSSFDLGLKANRTNVKNGSIFSDQTNPSFDGNNINNSNSNNNIFSNNSTIKNNNNGNNSNSNSTYNRYDNNAEMIRLKKVPSKGKPDDGLSSSSAGPEKKSIVKSSIKGFDDNMNVTANMLNKTIDQELYKKLKEHTPEKIYNLLAERIKQNLKGEVGQYLMECLEKSAEKL